MKAFAFLFILINVKFAFSSLYFDIVQNKPKCFIEHLYDMNSAILLKWRVLFFNTVKEEEKQNILKNIILYVYEEDSSKLIFQHSPDKEKSKTTFAPKKEGGYIICVAYKETFKNAPNYVQMNLKIHTEMEIDPNFDTAIKTEDVNKLNAEMISLSNKLKPIIQRQTDELEAEKFSAEETIKSTKWYKALTFIQIIVALIVGIIQLNNFRRFLKNSRII